MVQFLKSKLSDLLFRVHKQNNKSHRWIGWGGKSSRPKISESRRSPIRRGHPKFSFKEDTLSTSNMDWTPRPRVSNTHDEERVRGIACAIIGCGFVRRGEPRPECALCFFNTSQHPVVIHPPGAQAADGDPLESVAKTTIDKSESTLQTEVVT